MCIRWVFLAPSSLIDALCSFKISQQIREHFHSGLIDFGIVKLLPKFVKCLLVFILQHNTWWYFIPLCLIVNHELHSVHAYIYEKAILMEKN